jgi:hypothetical protein
MPKIIEKFGVITAGGPDLIAPSISNVTPGNTAATIGTVTFTLTNNIEETATVFYGITTPPTGTSVSLAGNTTSSTLSITGLNAGQSYVLYARTDYEGELTTIVEAPFTMNTIGYAISFSPTSINEGATTTATVTTTNFGSGTLFQSLEGVSGTINASDFEPQTLTGTVTITGNSGTFTVTARNDAVTEGVESFRARLRTDSVSGTIVATSNTVTINDTSLTPPPFFPPYFPPFFPPFFPPYFPPFFPPYFPPFFPPFFPPYFSPRFTPPPPPPPPRFVAPPPYFSPLGF